MVFCTKLEATDTSLKYFAIANAEQIAELMNIGTESYASPAPYLLTLADKLSNMNSVYQTDEHPKAILNAISAELM